MDPETISHLLDGVQRMCALPAWKFLALWSAMIALAIAYAVHGGGMADVIRACLGR